MFFSERQHDEALGVCAVRFTCLISLSMLSLFLISSSWSLDSLSAYVGYWKFKTGFREIGFSRELIWQVIGDGLARWIKCRCGPNQVFG